MKRQQWILASGGIVFLVVLYFFGNTVAPNKPAPAEAGTTTNSPTSVTTEQLLAKNKASLDAVQLQTLAQLENSVVRGDVKDQQIRVFHQLASYWHDTLHSDELGAYYYGEEAKLENSEKNLTFAAHLFLDQLLATGDPSMQHWLATQSKELFEKALELSPANDSSKIGLGACYMFGNISDNPMQGILAVKEVADKHPDNLYAQMMLGLGGVQSGQYDKAIERFLIVIQHQPGNIEAILNLAQAYERKGDKTNAVKWYTTALNLIKLPEARDEIQSRIKSLQ